MGGCGGYVGGLPLRVVGGGSAGCCCCWPVAFMLLMLPGRFACAGKPLDIADAFGGCVTVDGSDGAFAASSVLGILFIGTSCVVASVGTCASAA